MTTTTTPATREDEIAERFRRDTQHHEMTVLHDDGLYRHLRFTAPQSSGYWYELITWPGCLTVRGDYGDAYTFTRLEDMFEFFRSHRDGGINPHYWSQKVDSHRDGVTKYDREITERLIKEALAEAIREGRAPKRTAGAVEDLLDDYGLDTEDEARTALAEFTVGNDEWAAKCSTCGAGSGVVASMLSAYDWNASHLRAHPKHDPRAFETEVFTFEGSDEWDLRDYDWAFLWACHAIVAGIRQYDAAKAAAEADRA